MFLVLLLGYEFVPNVQLLHFVDTSFAVSLGYCYSDIHYNWLKSRAPVGREPVFFYYYFSH